MRRRHTEQAFRRSVCAIMGGGRHKTMDEYEEPSKEDPGDTQHHDKGELACEYADRYQKE